MQRSRPTPLFYRGPHAGRGLRRGAGSVSMRAAESRTLTAGSAFNEPVWATVLLDRRLSQATMIGIKGEGCRPGEQTHAVLLGRRTFVAPPADEGRQLKAGPLSMSHRTLWICPSRGRPLSVAPTPEVGEAGAHRPLEISRAIVAAHACVGAARFPQLHSASSSSITRHETDDEGVISEPEYTLTKPSSGPNHRDHLTRRVALRARSDLRLSTSTQDIWPAQPGCAGLSHPACPAVPPAPDPVPSRAMPVFGRDARQRRLAQPRGSGARLAQRRPGAAGPGSSPYAPPVGLCAEADHSETTGGAAAGEDRGLAPEPRESTGMAADTDWPGNARCRSGVRCCVTTADGSGPPARPQWGAPAVSRRLSSRGTPSAISAPEWS